MLRLTKDVIQWIKDYYKDNPDGKAIIGISGGKDSTICAALLVEALGADRVIGVMMPNGVQNDIDDSYQVCKYLGIYSLEVNIEDAYEGLRDNIGAALADNYVKHPYTSVYSNDMIRTNLPSRLRMATLYAVASLYPNSRVVNTSNWSERYIGYCTKGGDTVADFSPLGELTVREVLMIGDDLGLPYDLVHKTPSDGMSGKSDEEKIGFTYEELDNYILYVDDNLSDETVAKIEKMHKANEHKLNDMPRFVPMGRSEWI
jgi:NAD+ synthase